MILVILTMLLFGWALAQGRESRASVWANRRAAFKTNAVWVIFKGDIVATKKTVWPAALHPVTVYNKSRDFKKFKGIRDTFFKF